MGMTLGPSPWGLHTKIPCQKGHNEYLSIDCGSDQSLYGQGLIITRFAYPRIDMELHWSLEAPFYLSFFFFLNWLLIFLKG